MGHFFLLIYIAKNEKNTSWVMGQMCGIGWICNADNIRYPENKTNSKREDRKESVGAQNLGHSPAV
jgi:hypothetical protein